MIENKLSKIFFKVMKYGNQKELINAKFNKENWDSINHLKLVLELEKVFHVSFSIREIEQMLNFKKILMILKKKL